MAQKAAEDSNEKAVRLLEVKAYLSRNNARRLAQEREDREKNISEQLQERTWREESVRQLHYEVRLGAQGGQRALLTHALKGYEHQKKEDRERRCLYEAKCYARGAAILKEFRDNEESNGHNQQ